MDNLFVNAFSTWYCMLRFLIADDHKIVRRGLKQILQEGFPFVFIDEASDTTTLIYKATKEKWDIIVSDLGMPGGGGFDALKQIHKQVPQIPVLILSIYPEDQYALRVVRAGAAGYLNKDAAPEELVNAVQRILSGKRHIGPQVAGQLTASTGDNAELLPHQLLSKREYAVFALLALGNSINDIAISLSLAPTTVSTYRTRILKKMGIKSNADLIQYAILNKLN